MTIDDRFNPFVWVVGEPTIGKGTWVGPFCLLDGSGGLEIGDGCDISAGVQIYTHTTTQRCTTGRAEDVRRAPTRIGDRTHLGANAVVLMGVRIGSGCIVGAGAVVTQDVPDGACVVGVPARISGWVDAVTGDVRWE